MPLDALIFDIDGTLIDSNPAHVEAFEIAFAKHGYKVARDRIEVEVGKGGDQLVPAIIGKEADRRDGDAIRRAQPEEYARIGRARGFRAFPGALDLLAALRQRGLTVILATSSNRDQLAVTAECSGVDFDAVCDVLVTASDAKRSKPCPDIVVAAVEKAGLSPAQCAMVGDTLYDVQAARGAGVIGIGVETGYQSRDTLKSHGAREVYAAVDDILERLGEALHRASPTRVRLTREVMERLMREALSVAKHALDTGEAPIAALLTDGDGRIVARGHNETNRTQNRTAHAEIVTFAAAAGKLPEGTRDLILVSALEPCVMCTGAAMEAAVDTILFGLAAPADSGSHRVEPPQSPESQMPRIVGGILADESRELLKAFVERTTNPQQRAYVRQLLGLTK
jgi:HAD superfamily hydrolase (TIGR01509 family)